MGAQKRRGGLICAQNRVGSGREAQLYEVLDRIRMGLEIVNGKRGGFGVAHIYFFADGSRVGEREGSDTTRRTLDRVRHFLPRPQSLALAG